MCLQRRIFLTDSNQQQVVALTDFGYPSNGLRIGSNYATKAIMFPTSCSVGPIVETSSGVVVRLFVAELLGKIWSVDLQFDASGSVIAEYVFEKLFSIVFNSYGLRVCIFVFIRDLNAIFYLYGNHNFFEFLFINCFFFCLVSSGICQSLSLYWINRHSRRLSFFAVSL